MNRILYLSHDGALDPLGQSQIVPYLVRLSGPDVQITLITFEKPVALSRPLDAGHGLWPWALARGRPERAERVEGRRSGATGSARGDPRREVARLHERLRAANIRWVALRYHRWPPVASTLWDMTRGLWVAWRLVRSQRIDLVHARSYVMMFLAVILKHLTGVRVLFDMRELWVDGRVEGGTWPRGGWLYRLGKRCERWCLRRADAVVSLTEAGKQIIEGFEYWAPSSPPIAVIPTCVDVGRFANHRAPEDVRPAFLEGRRVIVYLGSIGSWYRFEEMVDCFTVALRLWPDALLLVLTPQPESAQRIGTARGLAPGAVAVRNVSHEEVPAFLRWAEVSLYFITPSYAKRSSCPTKLGESLAAGLPILTNPGIGDQDALLTTQRVGVLIEAFTEEAYVRAWRQMSAFLAEGDALAQRCRRVAQEHFGLDRGVETYARLYRQVLAP